MPLISFHRFSRSLPNKLKKRKKWKLIEVGWSSKKKQHEKLHWILSSVCSGNLQLHLLLVKEEEEAEWDAQDDLQKTDRTLGHQVRLPTQRGT